jgi:UDP-3-O-[3-hydroxymyristoyl] N-acetylglucosamine deacetylase
MHTQKLTKTQQIKNNNKISALDAIPFQTTILSPFKMTGIGVHSGAEITIILEPSDLDTGIIFERSDLEENNIIPAVFDNVTSTMMSTTLSNADGVSVSTVEHLMAALSGCGVTNCKIKVSGAELPIMDGSSLPFCEAINSCGIKIMPEKVKTLKIIKTVRVETKNSWAEIRPFETREFNMHFDFYGRMPKNLLENDSLSFNLDNNSFSALIAHARTFGFFDDALMLQEKGLAKGASVKNTIVIKDDGVLNEEGLRHDDEFIQHKLLDAIGDLALSNFHIIGAYHAYNGGHNLNNLLMRELFKSIDSWYWIESNVSH